MADKPSRPPDVSAFEITKVAERLRDELNSEMEQQRKDAAGRAPGGTRSDWSIVGSIQRRRHLKLLSLYIRRTLHEAYPHGPPHGNASWLLSNGNELVAALERIKAGTYGICADCGDEISLLRLWAQPQALLCERCQAASGERVERHWHFVI